MSRNLMNMALRSQDNSRQVNLHILRLHIKREAERKALALSRLNSHIVLHGSQVSQDALVRGRILGKFLRGVQLARHESDLDRAVFVVDHVDEGVGGAAVHDLESEDIRVGETCGDGGLEVRRHGGSLSFLLLSASSQYGYSIRMS